MFSRYSGNSKTISTLTFSVLLGIISLLVLQPITMQFSYSQSSSNMSSQLAASPAVTNDLDAQMKLESSKDPTDIATLAYIWGFPLVNVKRTIDFTTSPNIPEGTGRGPINTLNHFRVFPDANFTDIVRPNVDTLYSAGYYDLKNEPLVLQLLRYQIDIIHCNSSMPTQITFFT